MTGHLIATALALAVSLDAGQPLGGAEAICRSHEDGPALRVAVAGLKDRRGGLRIELYPPNDTDFLADDTALIAAGKPFKRVDIPTPPTGDVELCIRAPEPGRYAVVILHDRNGDRKFSPFADGIAFPNNPKLRFSKPKASQTSVLIGPEVVSIGVVLHYWNGLSMAPVRAR